MNGWMRKEGRKEVAQVGLDVRVLGIDSYGGRGYEYRGAGIVGVQYFVRLLPFLCYAGIGKSSWSREKYV